MPDSTTAASFANHHEVAVARAAVKALRLLGVRMSSSGTNPAQASAPIVEGGDQGPAPESGWLLHVTADAAHADDIMLAMVDAGGLPYAY